MKGAELCWLFVVLTVWTYCVWLGVNALLGMGGHCCSPWLLVSPGLQGLEEADTGCRQWADTFGSNIKIDVCCLTCLELLGRVS